MVANELLLRQFDLPIVVSPQRAGKVKSRDHDEIERQLKSALADMQKALEKMVTEKSGLKGLVLDLRNNPGGLLTQAVRVSDMFLESGLIVYTEGRIEAQKVAQRAQRLRQP